jgi:hypothetical protein
MSWSVQDHQCDVSSPGLEIRRSTCWDSGVYENSSKTHLMAVSSSPSFENALHMMYGLFSSTSNIAIAGTLHLVLTFPNLRKSALMIPSVPLHQEQNRKHGLAIAACSFTASQHDDHRNLWPVFSWIF